MSKRQRVLKSTTASQNQLPLPNDGFEAPNKRVKKVITSSQSSQNKENTFSSQESLDFQKSELGGLAQLAKAAAHLEKLDQTKSLGNEPIIDIDAENADDINQCPLYAKDIFRFYRQRESEFAVRDYMPRQKPLNAGMRAILIDWLVELQENFEMNHETLYLAVKLTDLYLSKRQVLKENLQLVGVTALFIAAKYDERIPPMIDDFLYVCDDAFSRSQMLESERQMLKAVDFQIGLPLSYRFLRRFAKCMKADLPTLTLARFVLESSLMHYPMVTRPESLVASACLMLALRMKNMAHWNPTLSHVTGYCRGEVAAVARELARMLLNPPANCHTVREKYSHPVFHEVATIKKLTEAEVNCLQ